MSEYNRRFRSGLLMGPTAFGGNATNPFKVLAPYGDSISYAFELLGVHEGHTEAVTCLALDANFLFSGSEDFSVKVWDTVPARDNEGLTATFKGGSTLVKTLVGHKRTVTSVEIEPSSGYLLSCGMDGVLNIWDYSQGAILKTFRHREELRCMVMRSDRSEVMVGTMQENILCFPLELEQLEKKKREEEEKSALAELKEDPEVVTQ